MLITVFTPTFNRAHLLPRLFESLCKQTYKDFEWVIVDDGSTDNTEEVVVKWIIEQQFPIRYFYQENGGKHRAINRGVKEAKGELFFIADSDDWLPDNALEIVANEYEAVKGDSSFVGIAGFDISPEGKRIGRRDDFDVIDCNILDLWYKYHVSGDMKEVFRTDVLREIPFPEVEGEKFCPEDLEWIRIAKEYKLRCFNKDIYIAEYQPNGLTDNIVRIRMKSPVASMMTYAISLSLDIPMSRKIRCAINYYRFGYCNTNVNYKSIFKKYGIKTISPIWCWAKVPGLIMAMNDKKKIK